MKLAKLQTNRPEFVALLWHLLNYVVRAEDRLQVQPRGLASQPVVQHVLYTANRMGGVQSLGKLQLRGLASQSAVQHVLKEVMGV